jgi:hypothetical protein
MGGECTTPKRYNWVVAAKYVRVPCINQDANNLTKKRLKIKAKIVQTILRELGKDEDCTILKETNRQMG